MSLAIDLDRVTPLRPHVGADHEQVSVEVIQERMKESGYLSLRKVGCEIAGGWFVLWGSVPSYYMKQMAQELAGDAVGLEKIKNRIQVRVN
jgi:osmotically-inducible protein OsmY